MALYPAYLSSRHYGCMRHLLLNDRTTVQQLQWPWVVPSHWLNHGLHAAGSRLLERETIRPACMLKYWDKQIGIGTNTETSIGRYRYQWVSADAQYQYWSYPMQWWYLRFLCHICERGGKVRWDAAVAAPAVTAGSVVKQPAGWTVDSAKLGMHVYLKLFH